MIVFADYEKKLVVPRWLSYTKARKTKELGIPRSTQFVFNDHTRKQFAKDYDDFRSRPALAKATDLMGAAVVLGEAELARELANEVLGTSGVSSSAQAFAQDIVAGNQVVSNSTGTHQRVAQSKQFLSDYPNDPFAWVDRARLYTVLGQLASARRCIVVALTLAPADRFVIRSAVRFFIHSNEIEAAWFYVKRAADVFRDPWIKAAEINVAELLHKRVRKLRELLPRSSKPDDVFQNSELIESVGMLELLAGNDIQAKRHFKLAWTNPTPNVVAHGEWVIRKRFPGLAESGAIDFTQSLEAQTLQHYYGMNIFEALASAQEWALEEPYSKRPFELGSSIACGTNQFNVAERMAREGLRANPYETCLLNNLCYSLLRANNLPEAERVFLALSRQAPTQGNIVYTATSGLLEFKRGNLARGRELYADAIALAEKEGNQTLVVKALVNLAIAECEAASERGMSMKQSAIASADKLLEKAKLPLPEIALARAQLVLTTPMQLPAPTLVEQKLLE